MGPRVGALSETFAAPLTIMPPDALPVEQAPAASPTESDVKEALAKVPPKWSATFTRFLKTLAVGTAAAFGVAWATRAGRSRASYVTQAFLVALGTAVVMAAWKALTWKDRMSSVTDIQKFVVSTIGAIVCIVLVRPRIRDPARPRPRRPAARRPARGRAGALGVQVATGYQASRVSTAMKAGR